MPGCLDYPGSPKARLDKALLVEPDAPLARPAVPHGRPDVTPAAEVPPGSSRASRIVEIEWGADTERFAPGASGPIPVREAAGALLAVFAGAFRAWHGAVNLVHAVRDLRHERAP